MHPFTRPNLLGVAQADDLEHMEGPAHKRFCAVSTLPPDDDAEVDEDCTTLSLMVGGWCGPTRDHGVSTSCAHKVQTFLETRPAVLHMDEVVNKKDPIQVRYLLHELIKQRMPVQVVFLQGTLPLEGDNLFPRLLELLSTCPVWSVNLGELRFSENQCSKLADTLRCSGVTHMFYECTVAGQWKETYREIIRANRAKHGFWRLGPDAEQNRVVLSAVKSWFAPTSHSCNKNWIDRYHKGWTNVERIQCEACGKWRRLPASLDGWPGLFYCALNTWDPRLASCDANEEEWSSEQPMNGDVVVCKMHAGLWLEGAVQSTPRTSTFNTLSKVGAQAAAPEPSPAIEEPRDGRRSEIGGVPLVFRSRNRKKPELYDASTSSTEYTRALRKKEAEDDEIRRASLAVDFVDGVTRCVRLDEPAKGIEWTFQREWPAKWAELRQSTPPPTSLRSGRLILYRVDGKGWRKVRLLKQGVPAKCWGAIRGATAGSAGACTKPPAKGGKEVGGGNGQACQVERERERAKEAEARASWWRVAYGSVQLLVQLSEGTRMHLWHAPEDAESCPFGTSAEDDSDVDDEAELVGQEEGRPGEGGAEEKAPEESKLGGAEEEDEEEKEEAVEEADDEEEEDDDEEDEEEEEAKQDAEEEDATGGGGRGKVAVGMAADDGTQGEFDERGGEERGGRKKRPGERGEEDGMKRILTYVHAYVRTYILNVRTYTYLRTYIHTSMQVTRTA